MEIKPRIGILDYQKRSDFLIEILIEVSKWDILNGCQCAVVNIVGEVTVIKCVTCPIHGDEEFRAKKE